MNYIVLAGIVNDARMAASADKPCCRGSLTFEPLQQGQPSGVAQLVAWGQAAEQLASPAMAISIVEGRLTLPSINGRPPSPLIEVSRLHHSSDGAADLNSISLVGRAGRDPEVRYFESGSVVANFTMAVNRGRDRDPDWFNLEVWAKQAQIAADYVRKGSLVGIIGSFKLDTWTDRATGEQRSKPVIRVDRLELLGSKRDLEGQDAPPPAAAAPARRSRAAAPAAPAWDGSGGVGGDDDIPF